MARLHHGGAMAAEACRLRRNEDSIIEDLFRSLAIGSSFSPGFFPETLLSGERVSSFSSTATAGIFFSSSTALRPSVFGTRASPACTVRMIFFSASRSSLHFSRASSSRRLFSVTRFSPSPSAASGLSAAAPRSSSPMSRATSDGDGGVRGILSCCRRISGGSVGLRKSSDFSSISSSFAAGGGGFLLFAGDGGFNLTCFRPAIIDASKIEIVTEK
ncbi:tetratricopeptide repeat protein [Striga asiatica]|uniref:Tetratricopeptide repeat protein n=1 Tax=Striga asiatica TaxID=4170 RepID=A0A5A7R3N4_STRAF|nr:tetratricopeptide repeat protein [Striga asiatica]